MRSLSQICQLTASYVVLGKVRNQIWFPVANILVHWPQAKCVYFLCWKSWGKATRMAYVVDIWDSIQNESKASSTWSKIDSLTTHWLTHDWLTMRDSALAQIQTVVSTKRRFWWRSNKRISKRTSKCLRVVCDIIAATSPAVVGNDAGCSFLFTSATCGEAIQACTNSIIFRPSVIQFC